MTCNAVNDERDFVFMYNTRSAFLIVTGCTNTANTTNSYVVYEFSGNIGLFRIQVLSTHDLLHIHHYGEDPNSHLPLNL